MQNQRISIIQYQTEEIETEQNEASYLSITQTKTESSSTYLSAVLWTQHPQTAI